MRDWKNLWIRHVQKSGINMSKEETNQENLKNNFQNMISKDEDDIDFDELISLIDKITDFKSFVNSSIGKDKTYVPFVECMIDSKLKAAKILLDRGADIDFFHEGNTPLMIFCHEGETEKALFLIENGANVNLINCHGLSALNFCYMRGRGKLTKALLEKVATE